MPNVKDLLKKIESGDISYEEKLAALSQVEASLQEMKSKEGRTSQVQRPVDY